MFRRKICVLGGGAWGKNHINTLSKLGVLGGVVDQNKSLLIQYKKEHPHIDIYTSLDEVLKLDFDGFIVATPAETHFELAKKIINCKKDLLVEKPFFF